MADRPIRVEKFNDDIDIDQRVNEGGIHANIYLGVQGNDMEAANTALENTIYKRLLPEKNLKVLEVRLYDILKDDSSEFFSGVAEVEFIAEDYRWFVNTIMRYGPSAIEIKEPEKVVLDSSQMHSIVADIADFAHMYSQQVIEMLKDPERRALYEKMLKDEK